ncbi:MAG: ECF transporter S component [Tissierellia bacterium]|nr:ECF transporter S component [Tissierellia bacterium]
MKNRIKTRTLTTIGLLVGIMIVLSSTPLGFIPIGPIFATTIHIPVIIAAVLLGKKTGALMGLFFGLLSLIRAYTQPTPTGFIFMDPLVSLLPRVLMGYMTGLFYEKIKDLESSSLKKYSIGILSILVIYIIYGIIKSGFGFSANFTSYILVILSLGIGIMIIKSKDDSASLYLTAIIGTGINTFLVLGMVYLIHAKTFLEAVGKSGDIALNIILSIAMINGLPEMLIAGIIVSAICKIALKNKLI